MLSRGKKSGPDITNENVIVKKVWWDSAEYGKYHEGNLGVTLPSDENKIKKNVVRLAEDVVDLKLSELAGNTTIYNKLGLKLQTNDLDVSSHELSSNTTYNFGLVGETAINVSGNYDLMLMGDNSGYKPDGNSLTLPSVVEFKGNNSLFPISQSYDKMVFSGNYENTVAEGTTVEAKTGLYVDAESTLNIEGTLVI